MKQLMNDVSEFHRCGGHPVAEKLTQLGHDRVKLRLDLILEEFDELTGALYGNFGDPHCFTDPVVLDVKGFAEVGDALTDMMYVIVGMGLEMGIPLDKFWAEVQRANMAKFPGGVALKREDGKVIKPDGWTPPNHVPTVLEHLAQKGD